MGEGARDEGGDWAGEEGLDDGGLLSGLASCVVGEITLDISRLGTFVMGFDEFVLVLALVVFLCVGDTGADEGGELGGDDGSISSGVMFICASFVRGWALILLVL